MISGEIVYDRRIY